MEENFKRLQELVQKLNSTNSSSVKIATLEQYKGDKFIEKILEYTYSPFKQFNVTSKNCKKNSHLFTKANKTNIFNIFKLLDNLICREVTGNAAIIAVNSFANFFKEFDELIYNIIDKDLKTRMGVSSINKAMPKCIPTFDVALAKKYELGMCDFENEDYRVSRKLDGIRCIVIISEGNKVDCYSRNGKRFSTLKVLEDEIVSLNLRGSVFDDIVLDGEICVMDGKTESFRGIMSLITRKDFTMPNPKFKVFDFLTFTEFQNKKSDNILSGRLKMLKYTLGEKKLNHIDILKQQRVESEKQLDEMIEEASRKNWEGLILRKNVGYEGKRSKNLLKVKKFEDSEYEVLDAEFGTLRVIDSKTGLEVEEKMLSNVIIEHKKNKVSVGSGFSMEQRREYYKYPERIIGKTICVKYFEETENKAGDISLRFPTMKQIWDDERDI